MSFKFTIPVELYKNENYNKLRRGYLLLIAALLNNAIPDGTIRMYMNDIFKLNYHVMIVQ